MSDVFPVSPAMGRWRLALVGVGIVLLLIALNVLLTDIPLARYPWIAAWLLGALIIHDGIIAMTVLAASILVRKLRLPVPLPVVLIVQGAVVVGAIVTLLVIPEIIRQAQGTANPSILPLDYVGNLVRFYVGLAVATLAAIAAYLLIRMPRLKSRQTS